MKSLDTQLNQVWQQTLDRKWSRIYWAIDLHDTVITGKYNKFNAGSTLYPHAKEALDLIFRSNIHRSILWTSSYADSIQVALQQFDLNFHYINTNPECPNTDICDFTTKFYFNVLLDDKGCFDANKDWLTILNWLKTHE
jgi:hypothetical protein